MVAKGVFVISFIWVLIMQLVSSQSESSFPNDGKCRVQWDIWRSLKDKMLLASWKGPLCLKKIIGKYQEIDSKYSIGDFKGEVEKHVFKLLVEIYTPTSTGSASGAGIGKRLDGPIGAAVGKVIGGSKGRVIGASYYVSGDDEFLVFQGERMKQITCKSESYKYKICDLDGTVTRILSYTENTNLSFCVKRFTFGIVNGLLYVTDGCNAKFTLLYIPGCVHRHSHVRFGKVSCPASPNFTTNVCIVPSNHKITKLIMTRQLSDDHCQYRYEKAKEKDNSINLHNGCGGDFIYRYAFVRGMINILDNPMSDIRICKKSHAGHDGAL